MTMTQPTLTSEEIEHRYEFSVRSRLANAGASPEEIQSLMETWTAGILISDAASERFGYDVNPIQQGVSRLSGFVDTAVREFYASRRSVFADDAFDFHDECYDAGFD